MPGRIHESLLDRWFPLHLARFDDRDLTLADVEAGELEANESTYAEILRTDLVAALRHIGEPLVAAWFAEFDSETVKIWNGDIDIATEPELRAMYEQQA